MYSRLGIHELKHTPNELLTALNPQVVVTVGTYEHGDAINRHLSRIGALKRMLPGAVIAARWWPDDHILNRMTRDQFASAFFKLHVPGTIMMIGNEDANDPSNVAVFRDTVNKHIQLMKLAHANGIAIGTCCVATGNPALNQYRMLVPLFAEMAEGRKKGIISWWRPNAYFTDSDKSHVYRHYNEAKAAAVAAGVEMPPTFLGELGYVRNFQSPHDGYHSVGMGDYDYLTRLRALKLEQAAAIYSYGVGVYDTSWEKFALSREFMRLLIRDVERTPYTAFQEWQQANRKRTTTTIKSTKVDYANLRAAPSATSAIVGTVKRGTQIECELNAAKDVYGRYWHLLSKPQRGYLASWVVEL